jgi:hypothetical protein
MPQSSNKNVQEATRVESSKFVIASGATWRSDKREQHIEETKALEFKLRKLRTLFPNQ